MTLPPCHAHSTHAEQAVSHVEGWSPIRATGTQERQPDRVGGVKAIVSREVARVGNRIFFQY